MILFTHPTVLYPTLVRGFIDGAKIRCECIDGTELWITNGYNGSVKLFVPPFTIKPGLNIMGTGLSYVATPDDPSIGKTFCVSHLQKKAYRFSLLYDPFIFHHWVGQPQKQDSDGNWIPGSERGNLLFGGYWRTPGWRWQKPDAVSNWTPWILSGGRIPGTHLD